MPEPRRRGAMLAASELLEPTSYKEAIESPENLQWKIAMDEENAALSGNSTWVLTALPPGRSAIANKWVHKRKINSDSSIRYNARLVIKGYEQRPGIDYMETFAPVAMLKTLQILLACAAHHGWHVHHMDVKSAFLNPILSQAVYTLQPEGF